MLFHPVKLFLLTVAVIGLVECYPFPYSEFSDDDAPHHRGNGPFEAFQPSNYLRQQLILGPALNVTVREGDAAAMPCIAPHLGDKTVSWIRQRDLAILASGGHVYTSDPRITSIHPSGSDLWGLQISPVRLADEGIYQCQVNTEPKQSRSIVLIVLEQDLKDSPSTSSFSTSADSSASSKLMTLKVGGSDRTVPEGGYVILVCSVTFQEGGMLPKNVEVAWWFKGTKLQEKISDPRIVINQINGVSAVTVELEIQEANLSDSGWYYCRAEPRYYNHQPRKPLVLRESRVSLTVFSNRLQNAAIPFTPCHFLLFHSFIFLIAFCYK